jgi:precorrin-6B methylase 2
MVVQEQEGVDLFQVGAGQGALRDQVTDVVAHGRVHALDGSEAHAQFLSVVVCD